MTQNARSPITTHVLDTTSGKAAAGVPVILYKNEGATLTELSRKTTNADGRVEDFLPKGSRAESGVYTLKFGVKSVNPQGFYPEVVICFEVKNPAEHYHIPLLLNPYGYSTYRGT